MARKAARQTASGFITPGLFTFFRDLKKNNRRPWFDANKARYEEVVKEPLLAFIEAAGPKLKKISPTIAAIAKASGGSLFRIYRDTRFSKDKTPYKTLAGVQFRHQSGKDAFCPGYYLHLEPGGVFAAAGIHLPPTAAANTIREAIVEDPAGWKKATQGKAFASRFELHGESLKRPPRGFDKEHPLIGDLQRKEFIGVAKLTEKEVCAPDFLETFIKLCKAGAPLMAFIAGALELDW